MTSRLLLSLSLLLLAWQNAGAQLAPADDFFNGGAQLYISNNIPAALQRVENGLKVYPEDEKLKKLEELLKQQQQKQQQQNQQNQKDQSQKQQSQKDQQNQKQQDQSQQQQKSPDQQQQEDQKKADQNKEEQQKQPEQPKSSGEKTDGEKPEDKNAEDQPVGPGQMTPAEAKRLLDSQKGDEQFLQLKPPEKLKDNQRKFKDW
jgi:outer membrane biosynthesis protein TonB